MERAFSDSWARVQWPRQMAAAHVSLTLGIYGMNNTLLAIFYA
jgi:hypothetical protein